MKKNKYTADVTSVDGNSFEIDGWAKDPQEFHKIIMMEYINYNTDEITMIRDENGNQVYRIKEGFCFKKA